MEFEPEPSYEQMESYLVFQVSTSSVQVTIMFFCILFPGRKTMNFRLQNLQFHWWLDSRIGAHTSDEQEPLGRGATNPAKVGFPSKNGGDFLMGFLMG